MRPTFGALGVGRDFDFDPHMFLQNRTEFVNDGGIECPLFPFASNSEHFFEFGNQ